MDFINFYIDDHDMKKDFSIIRTSGGEGFSTQLSPSFSIETLNAGGAKSDFLYTGRDYSSTQKEIKFATDDMSEEQLRKLMVLLYEDGIHHLRFDECPILIQDIVFAQPPTFDFNVFSKNGERVYKGTGVISYNIVSHYRYYNATTGVPELVEKSKNFDEWSKAYGQWEREGQNGFKNRKNIIKGFDKDNKFKVYNCGDFPTDFIMTGTTSSTDSNITIKIDGNSVIIENSIKGGTIVINGEKQYVTVTLNGKTDLVSFENRIPKIPVSQEVVEDENKPEKTTLIPVEIEISGINNINIDYKILYL